MAATQSALEGYFKRVYDDGLEDAIPHWALLQDALPFNTRKKLGDSFHFPVKLRQSHGTSWCGTADTAPVDLNDPVSLVTQDAEASGAMFILQEDITYQALSRAAAEGEASFGNVMDEVVFGMRESAQFYLESTILYGAGDIGEISANAGTNTPQTVTISAATWASGIWSQMEGAKVDAYSSGTRINLVNPLTVTAVDGAARKLVISGDVTDLTALTSGVVLRPYESTGMDFVGLDTLAASTTTQFGINSATYGLWRANTHTCGAAKLTMAKVQAGLARACGRGLMEDIDLYVSPWTWTDINDDLAALKRFAAETKSEMDIGTKKITFYGVNNGSVSLIAHPMMKAGRAIGFPSKRVKRVGSTDTTNRIPNASGMQENFFIDLESKAAVRLRVMWDQCIIPTRPATIILFTNITNQSLT